MLAMLYSAGITPSLAAFCQWRAMSARKCWLNRNAQNDSTHVEMLKRFDLIFFRAFALGIHVADREVRHRVVVLLG